MYSILCNSCIVKDVHKAFTLYKVDDSMFCGLYRIFLGDGLELERTYTSLDTIISNDMVELIAN